MSTPMSSRAPDESLWIPLLAAWIVSLVAMMGSLFFSEVMRLPPCVLCWYQRICMYPLAIVFTVGLVTRDRRVSSYAWPLTLAGLVIAVYHNLLYYHVIADSIAPCSTGVSCTDVQLEWFGFITIPLLSLTAFCIIVGCLVWFRARSKDSAHESQ